MTQKLHSRSAALGLASLGRNGDTTLVHMSPQEVQGLQNIALRHGTTLTINPKTGLPEAFNINKLLPMLGGAAVGIVAPWALPYVAAGTGIAEKLAGKSTGRALLDAAGVYGGGQLVAGLGAAGAATAPSTEVATATIPNAAPQAATLVQPEMVTAPLDSAVAGAPLQTMPMGADLTALPQPPVNPMPSTDLSSVFPGKDISSISVNTEAVPGATQYTTNMGVAPHEFMDKGLTAGERGSDVWRGTKGLFDPSNKAVTFGNTIGNISTPGKIGIGANIAQAFMDAGKPEDANKDKQRPVYYIEDPNSGKPLFSEGEVNPNVAKTGSIPEGETYFVGRQFNPGVYSYSYNKYEPVENMRAGGLANLAGTYKAGGKLLRGAGDGMSDSIPAVIGGKKPQRAALADGEFVIPADVVSHLGNGSTEAGSRKLYAMMDKIRHARTGRKKQAPAIKAERFMPR